MWLLDSRIDFAEKCLLAELTFPPVKHYPDTPESHPKVYFVPKKKEGLGIDSMGELAVSFELSGQFLDDKGNPAPFIQITDALEQTFHFSFGNAYKSKERVFKRKPFNLTKALDYLKTLIVRNKDEKR